MVSLGDENKISPNKIPHHNIKDENIEDYYFDDYRDTYCYEFFRIFLFYYE